VLCILIFDLNFTDDNLGNSKNTFDFGSFPYYIYWLEDFGVFWGFFEFQ